MQENGVGEIGWREWEFGGVRRQGGLRVGGGGSCCFPELDEAVPIQAQMAKKTPSAARRTGTLRGCTSKRIGENEGKRGGPGGSSRPPLPESVEGELKGRRNSERLPGESLCLSKREKEGFG